MSRSALLQDEADDLDIARLLEPDPTDDLLDLLERELEPGEKADDAVDYGDIDDDDLPDEEEATDGKLEAGPSAGPDSEHEDGPSAASHPEKGPDPDPEVAASSGLTESGPSGLEPEGQGGLEEFIQEALAPEPSGTVDDGGEGPDNGPGVAHGVGGGDEDAYEDDDDDDMADLFGDIPSSPAHQDEDVDVEHAHQEEQQQPETQPEPQPEPQPEAGSGVSPVDEDGLPASSSTVVADQTQSGETATSTASPLFRNPNFSTQQSLLLMVPAPPETSEEALAAMWPRYRRDQIPKFIELIPPKRARYVGKTPLKPPKPLPLTKVSLELAPDQEKFFRLPGQAKSSRREMRMEAEEKGLILISEEETEGEDVDEGIELEEGFDGEQIGATTWNDIQVACADWDAAIAREPSEPEIGIPNPALSDDGDLFGDAIDEWEREIGEPARKKQKTGLADFVLKPLPTLQMPSFDDPERTTANVARKVILDLNDPYLLIDFQPSDRARKWAQPLRGDFKRDGSSNLTKSVLQRYNISNDEAYDLLKENHQSKVRSTLGNLTVEHSVPALRLQYPYYKVKLARQEARSFHRPAMNFVPNVPIRFSAPKMLKRKRIRGKDAQTIFNATKDLSLADNSNSLLLEYSEEYPTMMSNFGMGSRLINYYRRKNLEDNARPKLDIGETAVLMPQDRSPFAMFGTVDAGETVPTLYNALFRAPIFKQNVYPTDFLVIRNTTGVDGSSWYMRNIENLYVVGQQFPSIDVPGPHSRKVTTASKNRLKMISYRKIRRNKPHHITVGEITEHFPDTTDLQNRQKMKEFMQFNKDYKVWEMRPGEAIPDEATVRAMLKPEDVCLLEASQVGLQHLQDAGYGKDAEDIDEDDGKEGQSLEQELAPWHTTRNFLNATQGKAMLQLHGEGDPSGRGEAFSFIRTSMKGGFKAMGESVEDKIDAKRLKELGGHSYNVARQQKAYEDSIRRIWEAQKKSLSSTVHQYDTEMEDDAGDATDDLFEEGITPRSEAIIPSTLTHRADDEISQFSTASQRGKVLRISREYNRGGQIERVTDVIRDPRVIREYLKRRHALEAENTTLSELKPTGDVEQDRRAEKRLKEELARLERNRDRTIARDKQKGSAAMSPISPGSPAVPNPKSTGTSRKCANCGQVGHIKTNKKLCPLLNGSMRQEDNPSQDGFGRRGSTLPPG